MGNFVIRLFFIALFVFTNSVLADALPRSNSSWIIEQVKTNDLGASQESVRINLVGTLAISQKEIQTLFKTAVPDLLQLELANVLTAVVDEALCEPNTSKLSLATQGRVNLRLSFQCDLPLKTLTLDFERLFQLSPQHVHFIRLQSDFSGQTSSTLSKGRSSLVVEITEPNDSKPLSNEVSFWQAFTQYLLMGMYHILTGWDHLALVLGIMLSTTGVKKIITLVSGFTLGHSLSLVLATLGIVEANTGWVEALIGFSIIVIAVEALIVRRAFSFQFSSYLFVVLLMIVFIAGSNSSLVFSTISLLGIGLFTLGYLFLVSSKSSNYSIQILVTVLFGIIHGFGFAGLLSEIGLPENQLINSLVAFNLGVELGQVLAIFVIIAITSMVKPKLKSFAPLVHMFSCNSLILVGSFWLVVRSIS